MLKDFCLKYRIKDEIKILVKIPTLRRPELLLKSIDSFYKNKSKNGKVFFVVSANSDDKEIKNKNFLYEINQFDDVHVFFGHHKSKVEAYNADINNFDFDILVAASDDMIAVVKNYDQIIIKEMVKNFPDFDGVLWFDTNDNNHITNTIPIMGKKYFDRFGYLYNKKYFSYYCDDELTNVAFKLGKIKKIPKVIISHNIPKDYAGMAEEFTYLKSLSNGTRDKAAFKIRKKIQFDLPGISLNSVKEDRSYIFKNKPRFNFSKSWHRAGSNFDEPLDKFEVYILENMDKKITKMDNENFCNFANCYFRDFRLKIPEIIHQIWLGELPDDIKNMMETFSKDYLKKFPNYNYIFWDEKKLESIDMINKDIYEKETSYDCKSDIARLEILNKFGGIYLDSDFVWLGEKSISSLFHMTNNGIMLSWEKKGRLRGSGYLQKDSTRLANTIFGASQSNPIIAHLIGRLRNSYSKNREHGVVASTGPDFLQRAMDDLPESIRTSGLDSKFVFPVWWCNDEKRNPDYEEFIKNRDLPLESLAKIYPEAVLFHRGFISNKFPATEFI
jgi:mannosyltransferase OCH1-like enzyme